MTQAYAEQLIGSQRLSLLHETRQKYGKKT